MRLLPYIKLWLCSVFQDLASNDGCPSMDDTDPGEDECTAAVRTYNLFDVQGQGVIPIREGDRVVRGVDKAVALHSPPSQKISVTCREQQAYNPTSMDNCPVAELQVVRSGPLSKKKSSSSNKCASCSVNESTFTKRNCSAVVWPRIMLTRLTRFPTCVVIKPKPGFEQKGWPGFMECASQTARPRADNPSSSEVNIAIVSLMSFSQYFIINVKVAFKPKIILRLVLLTRHHPLD
ncbi:hypothetical protein CPB85DRAFT_1256284 [Mucidula mucida]|nr:hypothetical protein CPB85DRAFT_1256284 [Mucidula mucida]